MSKGFSDLGASVTTNETKNCDGDLLNSSFLEFALNGPILSENEANMVRNYMLKDIHVMLAPSDKRFYHSKHL